MGSRPSITKAIGVTRAVGIPGITQIPGFPKAVVLALAAVLASAGASPAQARVAESEEAAPVPCAVIDAYVGEVDLLDSSRTHLLRTERKAAVPCGAWVSVKAGTIQLKHRDGHRIHLARDTFAQLPENNLDGRFSGDHLVLFGGEAFASAPAGSGELRVITANGRARLTDGTAIVVYRQADDETQLIATENGAQLENRFEPGRRSRLRAGEASSLNFKLLRAAPSAPKAVAIAALRPKFERLEIPARTRELATRSARSRQDRSFAAALVEPEDDSRHTRLKAPATQGIQRGASRARAPASRNAWAEPKTYERHDDESNALHQRWADRVVAGAPGAQQLLNPVPSRSRAAGGKVRVSVKDTEGGGQAPRGAGDPEKQRLIEELSRIRED